MSTNNDISYEDLRLYIEKMAEQDKERVNEVLENTDINDVNVVHIVTGLGGKVLPHCTLFVQNCSVEDIEGKRISYRGYRNPWGLDEYYIEVESVAEMKSLMKQYLVLSEEGWK